jgi:CelD/BcsL family acetyltransferase involved in cellulose biosynthesis
VGVGTELLTAAREQWDAFAEASANPFATHAWLTAWARARARRPVLCAALCDAGGDLLSGALLQDLRWGLASAADVHSGEWGTVAAGAHERRRLWREICAMGTRRVALEALREGAPDAEIARAALQAAGYGVLTPLRGLTRSPYVPLPASFDELLASRSRHLASQWRRKRRKLERAGAARVRLITGGSTLERDLDAFMAVEASGWKGRNRTAILAERGAEQLYRDFAREAAERGWLRLLLLELDGQVLAGDLGCVLGGVGFLLKTGFDERRADLSPGIVLRGEALREAVQEGLRGYDMLGGPDRYKLEWTDDVRPRHGLRAYTGPAGRAAALAWHAGVRPVGGRAIAYLREHPQMRRAGASARARIRPH